MVAEKLVLDWLQSHESVPVYMEIPEHPPSTFITVERLSGHVEGMVHSCSFAIQSWAESLYTACMLNERAKEAMDLLIESDSVSAVSLDSDYNFTDESTKRYRYQAIYDLVLFE